MKNIIDYIITKFFEEIKKMKKDEKKLFIHLSIIYLFIISLIYVIFIQNQTLKEYQELTTAHNIKLSNSLNEMEDDLNIIKILMQIDDNKNIGSELDKYFAERRKNK